MFLVVSYVGVFHSRWKFKSKEFWPLKKSCDFQVRLNHMIQQAKNQLKGFFSMASHLTGAKSAPVKCDSMKKKPFAYIYIKCKNNICEIFNPKVYF